MSFFFNKKVHALLIVAMAVVFLGSLFVAYVVITTMQIACFSQRTYSIPSNETVSSDGETSGGEAFIGESAVLVHVGVHPKPGAINVSTDTVIYVFQMRGPLSIDLHLSPEASIARISEEQESQASATTTLYPAGLLLPATTYNVSGFIGGYSAWWIFTTAAAHPPRIEYVLTPCGWGIGVAVSTLAVFFFVVVWRKRISSVVQEEQ